ncbi:MAG: hypothetical protein A2W10_01025 [Deltaproteobacteria bacterium RBG_16_55_12]|nr:MAG: hypothetical protein A2W10_01025 [Deltaproteobacteria bacterium RBG_16_55_12]
MSRSTLTFLLKAVVSLGLLFFLFAEIDMTQLRRVLSSAHLSYLAVALLGYFSGQIICSLRWALLARPLGFTNPFKDFVIFYFIGMFFNLFAPSTIGGDIGRVFYLARGESEERAKGWNGSTGSALVSVIADRFIGFAVLAWIGAAALVVFSTYTLVPIIRYLTFALAAGFLFSWMLLPLFKRLLHRKKFLKGEKLLLGLEAYASNRQIIVQTIALSLIAHLIQAWMQILLGQALDVEIPWSYALIIYPLVGTFSALPISLNGIGLREGGYLFLLRQIDVSPEKAIAFGILWFAIVVLDSLVGGVVFIVRKSVRRSMIVSDIKDQARVRREE